MDLFPFISFKGFLLDALPVRPPLRGGLFGREIGRKKNVIHGQRNPVTPKVPAEGE